MFENKQRKILFVVLVTSLILSLVITIPFGLGTVTLGEIIAKFYVMGGLLIVLSIIGLVLRYKNFENKDKYLIIVSNIPLLSGIIAMLFTATLMLIRSAEPFGVGVKLLKLAVLVIVMVLVALYQAFIPAQKATLNKKNSILVDVFQYVFFIVLYVDVILLGNNLIGKAVVETSWVLILAIVLFGLGIACLHAACLARVAINNISYLNMSANKLIEDWDKSRSEISGKAEDEMVQYLHEYTCSLLNIDAAIKEQAAEPAVVEVTKEVPVEKEVEKIVYIPTESTEKEEALAAEKARLEAMAKELAEKEEALKSEQASVEEREYTLSEATKAVLEAKAAAEAAKASAERALAAAEAAKANTEEKDQEVVEEEVKAAALAAAEEEKKNSEKKLAKLTAEKEALAAEKDRIALELELKNAPKPKKERVQKVLVPSYEDVINYAKGIEGIEVREIKPGLNKLYKDNKLFYIAASTFNDYRITFLCELDEAIKLIVDNPKDFAKATSPKGENWFKFVYKGDQNQYSETFIYDMIDRSLEMLNILEERKAAEKAEAKRIKAEAKAREKEQQKELAKRAKEVKAMQEAAEKALDPEEIAKAEEARKAKEAEEKAKAEAEKQKEKEKLAAEKAKEKEKARIAAQKQKEKEKAAAQRAKEREKAKLAAQKAKEKEKARLAAQKQKEKEKLAAQKAKEKEKEKLAAQKAKEKEKAKLAAEKAKEKEKAKLAAEKAKEKEKAKLAAEKAKEKEAAAIVKAEEK